MNKNIYVKPELRLSKRIIRSTMICQSTLRIKGNLGKDSEGQGQEEVLNAWEAD